MANSDGYIELTITLVIITVIIIINQHCDYDSRTSLLPFLLLPTYTANLNSKDCNSRSGKNAYQPTICYPSKRYLINFLMVLLLLKYVQYILLKEWVFLLFFCYMMSCTIVAPAIACQTYLALAFTTYYSSLQCLLIYCT